MYEIWQCDNGWWHWADCDGTEEWNGEEYDCRGCYDGDFQGVVDITER
jgi:hypothetical protein